MYLGIKSFATEGVHDKVHDEVHDKLHDKLHDKVLDKVHDKAWASGEHFFVFVGPLEFTQYMWPGG